ncbi:MAG: UDP-N-acetylmuramoyl-L-alanine--D-glutamate ligase [Brevundimonas sp.]|uniref:UDP-N-acetylmuramoyl-L-alanine--D-glutamate ligase n=1 Tax=Brevundimonas sp. TaxID=1871086 RepID=UPI0025C2F6DA|nr:UDP-N-acetylmuramoyl-L-alanine--D-glutamate ligase [Brevundimonas sp.]MBX3477590.1 UDP-N-acetylmuramoyl-L-alanine--D-glutamate ligase [Brevundimonas sp.]
MIPVPGFQGRRVAVFGLGRSGITAARALQAGGAQPVLWDDSVSSRMQAQAEGFAVQDLTAADWSDFAALVLSPGAPLTHPRPHWTVDKARSAGVEVIGDIELFARALSALPQDRRPRVVAITGTNGKSTTTALIGWVLKQAGLTVHVGGNIGIGVLALPALTPRPERGPPGPHVADGAGAVPEADLEVRAPHTIYVIEVSSYQLDLTTTFAPDVAILTNISPDHLDRHGGMEGYVAAKARIFRNLKPWATALVGVDEAAGLGIAETLGARARMVSTADLPLAQIRASAGRLSVDDESVDFSAARSLPGRHNAQNAAFAYAAARALGVDHATALKGLLSFPGLAHRMEPVGRLGRVRFVNDSKATNADAARQALSSYDRVFWIAGGRAKAGGIDDLSDLFPRVTEAFLIGEAAGPFAAALGDTPHRISGDMETAVRAAAQAAAATGREEVVLLSPAAASFDQYPDFEARGEAFRAAVLALGARPEEG